MEIERKFLVHNIPFPLAGYTAVRIEQGYLCTEPVVRIRKQDEQYILTYKSKGFLSREEYNLPLGADGYAHLRTKVDGHLISKTRYIIPLEEELCVELDVFDGPHQGLILAEVEFTSEAQAKAFTPLPWFAEDVTYETQYQNSTLSRTAG
ncbi:MAG: CYTH domain-containing protein [Lachnospiraceae bacterium]